MDALLHLGHNRVMQSAFMERAIELAIENVNVGNGGPFGAVIVSGGKIVGEGTNIVTSTNDPTAHAEITAIREACRRLRSFQLGDCEIYTSCEPCPMCLGAIYWARPKAVYFAASAADAAKAGFDDHFIYEQLHLPLESRSILMQPMMSAEGLKPFRAWAAKPDKISY